MTLEMLVELRDYGNQLAVMVVKREGEDITHIGRIQWQEWYPHNVLTGNEDIILFRRQAQELMDSLWASGLRPSK